MGCGGVVWGVEVWRCGVEWCWVVCLTAGVVVCVIATRQAGGALTAIRRECGEQYDCVINLNMGR